MNPEQKRRINLDNFLAYVKSCNKIFTIESIDKAIEVSGDLRLNIFNGFTSGLTLDEVTLFCDIWDYLLDEKERINNGVF